MVGNRTAAVLAPSDVAIADGWVVDAEVECVTAGVKRGQAYVKLIVALPTVIFGTLLCSDYVYSTFGQVSLGTYIQSGPGGGGGNLEVVTIKAESVPVASTLHTFAVSNEIRKILGFAWYYIASGDVATRTSNAVLSKPLGDVGATWGADAAYETWDSGVRTLTSGEDGTIFADEHRSGINDDGSLTISDGATNPSPFPFFVTEADTYLIDFQAGVLHANDLDIIYLGRESWVVL